MKKKAKKKNNYIKDIVILVAIVLAFGIVFIIDHNNKNNTTVIEIEKIKAHPDFIYLGVYDDIDVEDGYVFTNYEEYIEKIEIDPVVSSFNKYAVDEKDFQKNNYVFIKVVRDSCSESDITPTNYKINGENIDITFKYKGGCGVCAPEIMYYLLKVSKDVTEVKVNSHYKMINNVYCDPNVSYKPLIYLYPEEEMNISVKLGKPESLTTTYPKYNNSWNVLVLPDGSLYDKDGRYYYGLYWEGLNNIEEEFNDGFVVSKDDTIKFLEEKLSILGLNEREANEFIMYWLPKLEENDYNLIRFADIDVINSEMPLDISPKPDTVIRVLMEYKPLDKKINIKKQNLTKVERNGFTVVEWGGTLIK